MQININEIYLLVALIYMSEHQKATLFYGQAVQLMSMVLCSQLTIEELLRL